MKTDAITADPFQRLLASDNEVIRSAAIRALPKLADDLATVRSTLIECLLDEDPDVRCDAMEMLVPIAKPGDAAALRRSLEGDPVREVKLAAIAALAEIKDADAVPLLRALATSRTEERVAWEDATGDWDEWLDIQIAAIETLGELGAVDAIPDMIDALFDPYGQNVDDPVFLAFGRLGEHGASVLLETFRQTKGVTRRRAAVALGKVAPESLTEHVDELLAEGEAEIRLLGLRCLSPDDERCITLVKNDPAPAVRAEALRLVAPNRPDVVQLGLSDTDQYVKAAALDCLTLPLEAEFEQSLIENALLWLDTAHPALGAAILRKLVDIAPERTLEPLLAILDDRSRALELRVTAAKRLGAPSLETPLSVLATYLQNPARQVRCAVLTVLRDRVETDPGAMDLAAALITGEFEFLPRPEEDAPEATIDAGTPKEGAGPRPVEITPDGDIVERSEAPSTGTSTLDTLLAQQGAPKPPPMAEDTPEETGAKRAKRRPVEGSADLAETLIADALALFADVPGEALSNAIEGRLSDTDTSLRSAAWRALERRSAGPSAREAATYAVDDEAPEIRSAALKIRMDAGCDDALKLAIKDADPLIRAEAIKRMDPNVAAEHICDTSTVVRNAAAHQMVDGMALHLIDSALKTAIDSEASDVIRVLSADENTMAKIRSLLSKPDLNDRAVLVILRALGF